MTKDILYYLLLFHLYQPVTILLIIVAMVPMAPTAPKTIPTISVVLRPSPVLTPSVGDVFSLKHPSSLKLEMNVEQFLSTSSNTFLTRIDGPVETQVAV